MSVVTTPPCNQEEHLGQEEESCGSPGSPSYVRNHSQVPALSSMQTPLPSSQLLCQTPVKIARVHYACGGEDAADELGQKQPWGIPVHKTFIHYTSPPGLRTPPRTEPRNFKPDKLDLAFGEAFLEPPRTPAAHRLAFGEAFHEPPRTPATLHALATPSTIGSTFCPSAFHHGLPLTSAFDLCFPPPQPQPQAAPSAVLKLADFLPSPGSQLLRISDFLPPPPALPGACSGLPGNFPPPSPPVLHGAHMARYQSEQQVYGGFERHVAYAPDVLL